MMPGTIVQAAKFVLPVMAASTSAAGEHETAADISGIAAIEHLVGNTLDIGTADDGERHLVFFRRGGEARLRAYGSRGRGQEYRWSVNEHARLCLVDRNLAINEQTDCAVLTISGTHVDLQVDAFDEPLSGRVLQGNPYGL